LQRAYLDRPHVKVGARYAMEEGEICIEMKALLSALFDCLA
jgi:hypothetical protein